MDILLPARAGIVLPLLGIWGLVHVQRTLQTLNLLRIIEAADQVLQYPGRPFRGDAAGHRLRALASNDCDEICDGTHAHDSLTAVRDDDDGSQHPDRDGHVGEVDAIALGGSGWLPEIFAFLPEREGSEVVVLHDPPRTPALRREQ